MRSYYKGGRVKCPPNEYPMRAQFMSQTFAIFLLENANNGNEILAVLDDIVEVTDTVL